MRKIAIFYVLLFISMGTYAQEHLTNQNIISMKASKVSDDLLIAKINSSPNEFDISVQAISELESSKISDKVLKQIIIMASEKPVITNQEVIDLKIAKISNSIVEQLITSSPRDFDTSPDGLINLTSAKISKKIIKQMMSSPSNKKGSGGKSSKHSTGSKSVEARPTYTNISKECKPDVNQVDKLENKKVVAWARTIYEPSTGDLILFSGGSSSKSHLLINLGIGKNDSKKFIQISIYVMDPKGPNAIGYSMKAAKGNEFILGFKNADPIKFVASEVANNSKVSGSELRTTIILGSWLTGEQLKKLEEVATTHTITAFRVKLDNDFVIDKDVKDKNSKIMMDKFNCFFSNVDSF